MSYVIVGLGNPGAEYEGTRHNTGRALALAFARAQHFGDFEFDKKANAQVVEGKIKKAKPTSLKSVARSAGSGFREKVTVVLPDTFMNKSGQAVSQIKDLRFKIHGKKREASNLAVIHDDLDLSFGRFKISFNRGSGGHRGVESVIRAIKTEAFVRVRAGISKDAGKGKVKKPAGEKEVGDYILGKYKPAEAVEFKKVSKKVSEALALLVTEGREAAMQKFNPKILVGE